VYRLYTGPKTDYPVPGSILQMPGGGFSVHSVSKNRESRQNML